MPVFVATAGASVYDAAMIVFYPIGLILLALAFLASAAELSVHALHGASGLFVPFHEVWSTLALESLVNARAVVDATVGPNVWEPLLGTLLSLPGWLLFGLPGGILAWLGHPSRGVIEPEHEENLFLIDALNEAARKDGYLEEEADFFSDHHDTIGGNEIDDDPVEDMIADGTPRQGPPLNDGRALDDAINDTAANDDETPPPGLPIKPLE